MPKLVCIVTHERNSRGSFGGLESTIQPPENRGVTVSRSGSRLRLRNFKPLKDRLLVKYSEEPEKSSGGLYIPDSAKEKPQEGEVVAAGPGRVTDDGKLQAMEVKVGDIVLFEKYAGSNKLKFDDIEYIIIREDEILGILNK